MISGLKSELSALLQNIKKKELQEIICFSIPPTILREVAEAVLILKGSEDIKWQSFQKLLKTTLILDISKLNDIDFGAISDVQKENVKKLLKSTEYVENVKKVSSAAYWLAAWA